MAEHDPTTTGRKRPLPLEILTQTVKGNVRSSLDEFEMRIRKYGRSCKKVLPDCMKVAVVQTGLENNDLRRHLLARVDWPTTHLLARKEVRSIITACDTPTGLTPTVLLDRLDRVTKDEFDAKMLGTVGSDQLTEAKVLKRTVRWHEQQMCFSWAGGTRCVTELVVLSGRTDTLTVTNTRTPSTKATDGGARDAWEPLEAFRTAIVIDRPDGQYAAKATRNATTEPETLDWMRMTRLANSRTAHDELEWLYHAQDVPEKCMGCGDPEGSGSEAVEQLGQHLIEFSCTTRVSSLSRAERQCGASQAVQQQED